MGLHLSYGYTIFFRDTQTFIISNKFYDRVSTINHNLENDPEFNKTIFSIKQYFIFMANQLIYNNKI